MVELLRSARINQGVTIQAAAERLGVPVRTLSDWERGERTPPEYVQRWALERLLDNGSRYAIEWCTGTACRKVTTLYRSRSAAMMAAATIAADMPDWNFRIIEYKEA